MEMYMRCMDERRAAIRKCKKLLFVSYKKKRKKRKGSHVWVCFEQKHLEHALFAFLFRTHSHYDTQNEEDKNKDTRNKESTRNTLILQ